MLKVRPLGANEWLPHRPGCARYRALVAAAYGVWPVTIPEGYEILGYGHGIEGVECHYAGANKGKVGENSHYVHQIEGPLPYGVGAYGGKWVPRMLVRPLAQENACQAGPGTNWATQDWSYEAAKAAQQPGAIVPAKKLAKTQGNWKTTAPAEGWKITKEFSVGGKADAQTLSDPGPVPFVDDDELLPPSAER